MTWFFLAGAILSESAATLCLRMAAQPGASKKWFAGVVAGFVGAFGMLTLALRAGLAIGVAYGIWAASGVALTAVASRVLFGEPLTRVMVAGLGLIIAGVLLVELGAAH
ncbi:SMR family transporter [Actinoplanes sp. NPDC051861]|uniref:DMT family transporter n=1 Tax=Actinoplanes sp. NPDC051861 TaxID=3155170 RepID=UPI00343A6E7D